MGRWSLSKQLKSDAKKNPVIRDAERRYNRLVERSRLHSDVERFREHREKKCDPADCPYVHTKRERAGGQK